MTHTHPFAVSSHMYAFCSTPVLPSRNSRRRPQNCPRRLATTPCSLAKSTPKSKSSASSNPKRLRSNKPGFGETISPPTNQPSSSGEHVDASGVQNDSDTTRDIRKIDVNGISLEHRLREEIAHPLRKPKQTLFGTLAFSATLGFFFALGRYATHRDALLEASKNVAIDFTAITLFAYLTWRQFQFGRRSINSIAGRPQARDLKIVRLKEPRVSLPFLGNTPRLSSMLRGGDVVVVAGRRPDVLKYLGRCMTSADDDERLIAFPTDIRDTDGDIMGADAVASTEKSDASDWIAWLGDAIPPKRNVALFRIEKGDKAAEAASSYVVAIDDPAKTPLPSNARRPEVVEV